MNQMKILKRQWFEEIKDWTNNIMVEEDEMLNKVKIEKNRNKKGC